MTESKELEEKSVRFRELFQFATSEDYVMILIGSLGALGMGILQPCVFLGIALAYGQMDEDSGTEDYLENASEICLYMIGGGFLLTVFGLIAMSAWIRVGARQAYHFRVKTFKRILKLDCEWFDRRNTGEIPSSLANDFLKVERATGDKVINFLQPIATILTVIFICVYFSVKLSLFALAFGTVVSIGFFFVGKGLELKSNTSFTKAASIAEEALMEIKTVSSLNAQKFKVKKFSGCLEESEKHTVKTGMITGIGMGMATTTYLFALGTIFYIGVRGMNEKDENWVRGNEVGLTEVQAILYTIMITCNNLASLIPAIKVIKEGKTAAMRLLAIIHQNTMMKNGYHKKSLAGDIEFEDVYFSYPTRQEEYVLKGLSFKVRQNTHLGIVGSTGSGKSTIVQLLLRFQEIQSGNILIDRIPIQEWDRKHLRNSIGLVNQEPFLFDASILENIRYGKLNASFKEVREAAYQSGALEFINDLPEEFDTLVGPKGSQLSGGQKQRIVIARAILRDPSLLILDEATSALDLSTEQSVMSRIEECLPKCTRISIAQNLLTLKNCDDIIVLENGHILEQGNHTELMEIQGKYFNLFRLQNSSEILRIEEEQDAENKMLESIKKNPELTISNKNRQNIKRVLQLSSSQLKYIVLGILGSVLVGSISPINGIIIGNQINLLASTPSEASEETSLDYSKLMFIFNTVVLIGFVIQSYGYSKTSSLVTSQLRKKSLSTMLSYDSEFYSQNHYAVLSNQLARDCELINYIGATFVGILGAFLIAIFVSVGISSYYSWQIAIAFLGITPISTIAAGYGLHGAKKGVSKFDYSQCEKVVSDSLMNIKTIKALCLEKYILTVYQDSAEKESQFLRNAAFKSGFSYGLSLGVMYWYYAFIIWFGAKLMDEGEISFKEMVIANATGLSASNVLFILAIFLGDIGGGFLAAQRIFALLDYKPKIDVKSKSGECNPVQGRIEFTNVSFSYPNRDCLALKNISFVVEPRQKCAIIGRTGSGKSTISQLLIRLYDPSEGSITLDYVSLDRINLKYLRNNVGIVIQEPVLFSGSIEENITLGKNISQIELSQAIEIAQASDFVDTNELKRDVGFKGSNLSGGQKQRIAIARTILRKPKIIVFDEATSALDTETESNLLRNIESAFEGCTWIVIAHRIKTVSDADVVLVLESGQVLEFGTKEELMHKEGYFHMISSEMIS